MKVKGLADCKDSRAFQTAILKYNNTDCSLPESEINYIVAGPNVPGKVSVQQYSVYLIRKSVNNKKKYELNLKKKLDTQSI